MTEADASAMTALSAQQPADNTQATQQHQQQQQEQPSQQQPQQQQQQSQPTSPSQHDDDDSSMSDSSDEHQHPPHDPNDPSQLNAGSSSQPYIPSGHNKTKGGYRKVIRKDKQKHNESESRRRSRLRGQFMELRTAAKCSKKDRFSILNHALERFAYLEERIQQLEKMKGGGAAPGLGARMASAGVGEAGEAGGADSAAKVESGGGMEGGMTAGGVAGTPNSSFSAPAINRASSVTTPSSVASSSDPASNGTYAPAFHPFDTPNSSANTSTTPHNSSSPSSSAASATNGLATLTALPKLLSDPLSNYPILSCLPTCFIALDGKFKDTNLAFCNLLQYSREALLQTTLFTVTHPNELMPTFAQLKRLLGGELDCWEGVKLLVRGDGSVLSVHMTITCAKKYNKPDLYVGFFIPKGQSDAPPTGQPVSSPQPQTHLPPPVMYNQPAPPLRSPMQSHPVGTLARNPHSSFTSYGSGYADPAGMTSPHSRQPMTGSSFIPTGSPVTPGHIGHGGPSGGGMSS